MMPSSERYFANTGAISTTADAHAELLASLERINTYNPPVQTCSTGWKFHGLYTGPTSIAYLFYRLAVIYPDLQFKSQSLWDWAQAYIELSKHIPKGAPDPNHCGIANETLAYIAIQAVMLKDTSLVSKLCSYQNLINSKTETGSNEWLYGRAGYLYLLRFARSAFTAEEHSSSHKLLAQTIERTIERIFQVPLPWTWHGREYLSAAHGTVRIICQVVLSDPTAARSLKSLLADLVNQQYPSGNFHSSFPAGSDRLVQFCHGAPGFVLSLRSLRQFFPELETEIDSAIEKARQDMWNRGLLTKDPCFCHAIPGNALALQDVAQIQHFLAHMTTAGLEERDWMQGAGRSDEFVSLFTGEAGRAWTWATIDQNLPQTCIGYNDV